MKISVTVETFNTTHHWVLGLDGSGLETVVHSTCAPGVRLAIRAYSSLPGVRLSLPDRFANLQPWRGVAALFLGNVGFGSMNCFHMFPQRTGVSVALRAAWNLADVRFLSWRL